MESTMGVSVVGLEPRFVEGERMRIAGLRGHFKREEIDRIPAQWQRLAAMGEIAGRVSRVEYAVVLMVGDGCDYVSGYEVEPSAELPAEFYSVNLPGERYAVFAHEGHVSKMRYTFGAIFDRWLPESGMEVVRSIESTPWCLERYGERFQPQTGMGDVEIWVPVKNRIRQQ